ncbi:hypothetical protein MPLA_180025 [Mesorhizobium sp. ORS 3359]|nr:hypothetical protein MPLA_180025 [Mesorhizobium sp. ORS 3359]
METRAREAAVSELTQRIVATNGIRLNIAEHGDGPPVLLCHGFPESWYSWRHQLSALAAAGFHAVAPDMRGYGKSDRPEAIDHTRSFIWSATWWAFSTPLKLPAPSSSATTGARSSPGMRRCCDRTASMPSSASVCRSGRAPMRARPASCRERRSPSSTSSISSNPALPRRSWNGTRGPRCAPCFTRCRETLRTAAPELPWSRAAEASCKQPRFLQACRTGSAKAT